MTKTNKIAAIAAVVGGVIAAASSASAALNLPTQSCSYTFNNNLKRGMTSSDVKDLQIVLNMYPQTQVAPAGQYGGPGMETTYFGSATYAAAVKFQNLHQADILTPAGLAAGNGNVFSLTRAVLNQICNGTVVPPTSTSTPVSNVSATLGTNVPYTVLVSGQTSARLADFVFTGNGTVTNLRLMRTGVSANDTLTNVYLYDGNTRLTDAASVASDGSITFNSASGLFTVAGARVISVRADIASGISGQTVGVMLSGYNTGSGMMTTALNGTQLPVSSVSLATFGLTSQTVAANTNLTIPQMNYNVWGSSINVGTRSVNLKSMAFRMIGSAPASAVANVNLFIDGVSAGTAVADANGMFTFAPNRMLTTGGHTVEVRADVVAGSARDFYFVVDNAADIMAEDSQVIGVNVPVSGYSTYRQAGKQTISSTSNSTISTVNDPAFSTTNVVAGASNQTIAQYKLTAYGESTKIQNFDVTVNSPSASGLSNVSVYVNGAQVGSSQTYTTAAGTKTYTFGSNFIAQGGVANTIEIKGDMIASNGTVLTSGTVSANISNMSAQGMSSYNTVSGVNPSLTVKNITIGGGSPVLGKTIGGVNTTVSANSLAKIGSFTIQGGSIEAVNVRTLTLSLAGTGAYASNFNTISNLSIVDEMGATIGIPVGIASANNTYNVNLPVAIGQTKRFDVMANIGSATNGDHLTPSLAVTYTGATSNQSTNMTAVAGDQVTIGAITVNTPTVSSKTGSQYVLGGSSQLVYTLNSTVTNGAATLNDLTFDVTGSGVASLTIGANTAAVVGTQAKFLGINLAVPAGNNGLNVPVTVNYTPAYVGSGAGVASGATNSISLTAVKATDAAGIVTNPAVTLAANTMTIVTTLPTVSAVAGSGTLVGVNGASVTDVKIGSIRVAADAKGDIVVGKLAYSLNAPAAVSDVVVKVNGSVALDKNGSPAATTTSDATFTNGYRITAGSSVVFDIYGTVAAVTNSGTTSATLGANASFLWSDDVSTAGTALNGTLLNSTNYAK
ncbi:MAG: hypothetical protein QG614_300 [Patescibacteria group bacterium]|nr:hypothetical protein [Patescibacteria group bacterium]